MKDARALKAGEQAVFAGLDSAAKGGNIHLAITRAGGKCSIEQCKHLTSINPVAYDEYLLFTMLEPCKPAKPKGRKAIV